MFVRKIQAKAKEPLKYGRRFSPKNWSIARIWDQSIQIALEKCSRSVEWM